MCIYIDTAADCSSSVRFSRKWPTTPRSSSCFYCIGKWWTCPVTCPDGDFLSSRWEWLPAIRNWSLSSIFQAKFFFVLNISPPPFFFKEMIWTDLDKTAPRPAIFYRDHSDVCSVRPTSCRKGIRRWRTNCSWSNWIWLCLNPDRSVSDTGQLVAIS